MSKVTEHMTLFWSLILILGSEAYRSYMDLLDGGRHFVWSDFPI